MSFSKSSPRSSEVSRRTAETDIRLKVSLDGSGLHEIDTGIGFLDHMLTHLAVHGLFDITLKAVGDLQVDPHHTVEDVALCL
jgi:imidazoleglycerol-phosphate dehydratase